MCDYSLAGLRTRLAVEGEELVLYRFPTGSLGLTSPAELEGHRKEFRGWQHRFLLPGEPKKATGPQRVGARPAAATGFPGHL